MKSLMSSLFTRNKRPKHPNYVKPKDIKKVSTNQPVEEIPLINNGKPNILFMDDSFAVAEIMKSDIELFSSVKNHDFNDKRIKDLWESLNSLQQQFLNDFDPHRYNFYFSTTNMCGFSVENAVNKGIKFDGAILDIVLGGILLEEDRSARIIDGIDIAYQIKSTNPKFHFKMYTACTLGEYSEEATKYRKLFKSSIFEKVIYKNSDLNYRRKEMINLLMKVEKSK